MAGARRERLLDAAIGVLGTEGLRRLTHRAVDAAAGLPAGSTSNYLRTRQALIEGIVGRLAAHDRDDWEGLAGLPHPAGVAELAGALAGYAEHATGPARARTAARYALFLETASHPELREPLTRGRAALIDLGTEWLRQLGSGSPQAHCRTVLAYLDGLILHQLTFPDPAFDPRPGIHDLLASLPRPGRRPGTPAD